MSENVTMNDVFMGRADAPTKTETTEQTTEQTPTEGQQESQAGEQQPTTTEPQGTQETTASQEQQGSQESTPFDVTGVNDYFGRSFKDETELKTLFETQDKFKDFEDKMSTKDKELQSAQEKYTSLLDSYDPEKIYPNKEVVALSQLAEKYPQANPGIISQVRATDLDGMNKLEALVLINKLKVPSNASDNARQSVVLQTLGIDADDIGDLSDVDKLKIDTAYANERNLLDEIKGFQPEISKFDFEAEKATRKEAADKELLSTKSHNEKALKILLDDFKEIRSPYKENDKDYSHVYNVEDKFKTDFFNELLDNISNSGVRITTENANEVKAQIANIYRLQNWDNIIQDVVKQTIAKQKEQGHDEMHSSSETNRTEAPPGQPKVEGTVMEQIRAGALRKR